MFMEFVKPIYCVKLVSKFKRSLNISQNANIWNLRKISVKVQRSLNISQNANIWNLIFVTFNPMVLFQPSMLQRQTTNKLCNNMIQKMPERSFNVVKICLFFTAQNVIFLQISRNMIIYFAPILIRSVLN